VRVPAPTVRAPATATVPTLPGGPGRAETPASATNPAVPPVVTQLEAAATEGAPTEPTDPVTPTEPSADPVEAFVAAQGVSYSAVVLGPVNTGILQTRTGYLVVTVGQKLLDSEVVVKDITATNVVLAIGNQQKTLELDKR
jgi:hypothetical protein